MSCITVTVIDALYIRTYSSIVSRRRYLVLLWFKAFLYPLVSTIDKPKTLPIGEILSGQNLRAFFVCGFLMKSLKKIS